MNAIITAATGYTEADIQVFLRSVERNCRNTKVFIIVNKRDRETIADLRSKYQCVDFLPIRKKVPWRGGIYIGPPFSPIFRCLNTRDYSSTNSIKKALGRYSLHILIERFFIALQLVQDHRDSFTNILLTDSRDIIIQSDPFSLIDGKLTSGFEEETIGNCPGNSSWIKRIYGKDVLSQMFDRRIVCAGVTLGPTKEVENYLNEMCSEMWRCLPKIIWSAGFDQGIHNYLIFKEKFPIELTDNRQGIIATLHYEKPLNILKDPATGLVKIHGSYPAIVHQYDRHPDLVKLIKESPAFQ